MKQKTLSSIEELLNFYNRYLALDNDDHDIKHIVVVLSKSFISKIKDDLTIKGIKDKELIFKAEDFATLSRFELSCIKFYYKPIIKIDNDFAIVIDAYGKITSFITSGKEDVNNERIGMSIMDYINENNVSKRVRKDLKNVITQNILVSKIYQAINETLQSYDYLTASLFQVTNAGMLNYEENLNNSFDVKKCLATSFGRTRSQK